MLSRHGRTRASPDHRAKPREQLAKIERLREIVVGTAVEPGNPIFHSIARGQHQHWHGDPRRRSSRHTCEAARARQHHVEHDGVVIGDRCLINRRVAVAGEVDCIRVFAQAFREHACRVGFVFDKKDAHKLFLVLSPPA